MKMFLRCTLSGAVRVKGRVFRIASSVPSSVLRAKTFRQAATFTLLFATGLIAGCVQSPLTQLNTTQGIMSESSGVPASSELTRFLAQASAGSATTLSTSPWGTNVGVVADAPYFSASRRICRHLTVTRQSNRERHAAVACKSGEGAWVTSRLVTALYNGAETW